MAIKGGKKMKLSEKNKQVINICKSLDHWNKARREALAARDEEALKEATTNRNNCISELIKLQKKK